MRCASVRGCTFHDWCLRHWSNDHWLLAPVSPEHSTEPSAVQWPCLLITTLLVTTTHPVLRPNIFISKHFRLSVLSGFPGLAITQSRGAAGALSLTGAGLSTVATLYCLNRRDFGVSAAALAPAVIGGTGHSLVTVAWQIPEVARFPMAGGGSV